ncbi:PLD nuclease N-terminal domain-containing protein [Arthrobacter castelli]|uniref:PLD nuclease N-terminal domain-containing protein n=1 Tax=Arthrobacter castelli TaxID=271431 RepID=UPI000404406D|nr:PLD nuclease N-terminal domain-containing protein [Arthrobacter castelli]
MAKRKSWTDLSEEQRRGVSGAVAMQLILLAAALIDIARRPQSRIRGSKLAWAVASLVNIAGPICYFIFGRKR